MKTVRTYVKKVLVLLIGVPIVVIGVILVPLPGPGLLIMFAGLFIISLEFDWAKKHVDTIQAKLNTIIDNARGRSAAISKHDQNNER